MEKSPHPPTLAAPTDAKQPTRAKDPLNPKLASLVRDLINHHIDLQFAKKELESLYIREVLRAHDGHIGQSATALGMHRNTLSKRIKALKIPLPYEPN